MTRAGYTRAGYCDLNGMVVETSLAITVEELRAFDREDSPAAHSFDSRIGPTHWVRHGRFQFQRAH